MEFLRFWTCYNWPFWHWTAVFEVFVSYVERTVIGQLLFMHYFILCFFCKHARKRNQKSIFVNLLLHILYLRRLTPLSENTANDEKKWAVKTVSVLKAFAEYTYVSKTYNLPPPPPPNNINHGKLMHSLKMSPNSDFTYIKSSKIATIIMLNVRSVLWRIYHKVKCKL